jgi:hypothetical protein
VGAYGASKELFIGFALCAGEGRTMPTLFVKCRACGQEFPTPIGESEPGHSGVIISGLSLRCPKCAAEDQYSTADFHVPVGSKSSPAEDGTPTEPDLASAHHAQQGAAQEKLAGAGVVPPEGRSPRVN